MESRRSRGAALEKGKEDVSKQSCTAYKECSSRKTRRKSEVEQGRVEK